MVEQANQKNMKYVCECGSIIINTKTSINRHLKTKKHTSYVISLPSPSSSSAFAPSQVPQVYHHCKDDEIREGPALILKEDEIRKASTTESSYEIESLDNYYSARKESMDFHQSYPKMFKLHCIWSRNEYRILECDTFNIIPDANIPDDLYHTSVRLKRIVRLALDELWKSRDFTRENLKKVTIFNLLEQILLYIKARDETEHNRDAELLLNRNNTMKYFLEDKLEHIKSGQITVVIVQTPTGSFDLVSIPYYIGMQNYYK